MPETTGAANDVPLAVMRPLPAALDWMTDCGDATDMALAARPGRSVEIAPITRLPGAMSSGLRMLSCCVAPFAST